MVEAVGSSHRQREALVEELSAPFAGLYVEAGQASARDGERSEAGGGAGASSGARDGIRAPRPVTTARMPSRDAATLEPEGDRAGSQTFGGDRFATAPPSRATPEEARAWRAALQMAAPGRTRGEVAHHLHEVFDLDRVEPVLAHIVRPGDDRR